MQIAPLKLTRLVSTRWRPYSLDVTQAVLDLEEPPLSVSSQGASKAQAWSSKGLKNGRIFLCIVCVLYAQLQKVFLPPGTCFLRQNFPNIEEEFS